MASSGLWSSRVPRTPPFQSNKELNQGLPAKHPSIPRQPWVFAVTSGLQACLQPGQYSSREQQSRSLQAAAHHGDSSIRTTLCGSAADSKLGCSRGQRGNCSTRPVDTNKCAGTSQYSSTSCHYGNSSRQQSSSSSRSSRSQDDLRLRQPSGAAIMKQLKSATTWQQLQQLVRQHEQNLNQRHSSALITHLAQITAAQQQALQSHTTLQDYESSGQQQKQQPEQPGLNFEPLIDLQQLAAVTVFHSAGLSPFSSGENSSSGNLEPDAQNFLRHTVAPLVDAHMQQYDARGLANIIWAVAHLQPLLQPGSEPYPSRRWLGSFCRVSQPLLHSSDAQQLSNMLWALVQLQHPPPDSWLKQWYAAFAAQAGFSSSGVGDRQSSGGRSVQLQSLSTALWSLAHIQQSSNCPQAPEGWVQGLLRLAAAHLQSSGTAGTGQAISNLLWSCVQLQQQPPCEMLEVLQQHAQADAAGSAAEGRQLLSDQALCNIMWSLGKLWSQWDRNRSMLAPASEALNRQQGQTSSSSSLSTNSYSSREAGDASEDSLSHISNTGHQGDSRVTCSGQSSLRLRRCCGLLLIASTGRVADISWRHLASITYAAGMLQLRPSRDWMQHLEQRLQQPAVAALGDQELSNLLWGLSHLQLSGQLQQQQSQTEELQPEQSNMRSKQQQPSQSSGWFFQLQPILQHVLDLQQRRLPGYSSLALHSSLLSLGRLGFSPPEPLLQVWLKELARRNYMVGAGGQAMAEACCAIALLRRNQTSPGNRNSCSSSSSSRWGGSSSITSRGRSQQSEDSEFLTEFCAASASRLSACSADQLSGIGWALAALGFRPSVSWASAWQSAVAAVAATMSGAAAARALWALNKLPFGPSRAVRASAAAELMSAAVAAAAAGKSDAHSIAAAADCIADLHRSCLFQSDAGPLSSDGSCSGGVDAKHAVEQLLLALPSTLQGVTSHELLLLLSAAAAVGAALPCWMLSSLTQRCQYYMQQQLLDNQIISGMLVAVAQLWAGAAAASKHSRSKRHSTADGHVLASREVIHKWAVCMLRHFRAEIATSTELTMLLWSLAVLDHPPGHDWINHQWLRCSQPLLPKFTASQLASVGWALTVLSHKPSLSWRNAWAHAAAVQAAAATPTELALLLYSAATLGCQVEKSWLMSTAVLAANSIHRWSLRDLSYGLWGLAQLGLRAVADGELLEVLFSQMTAQSATAEMQGLSQFHLLQLLQAAVLLRPPVAAGSAAAAVVGSEEWWFSKPLRQPVSRTAVRRLRWRAKTATRQVHATAAEAVAANQYYQLLLSSQSSGTGSSSSALEAAAAAAQEAAAVWRAQATAAAYASAALTTAATRRNPDAVGVPVDPSWVMMWCQVAAQHVRGWSPSTAAAVLSSLAALGVPPPVLWQQQVLQGVLQRRRHIRAQDISTISRALELLRSPLRQQWLSQLSVCYAPVQAAAAAAGMDAGGDHAMQRPQEQHRLGRRQRRREWQRRWLQQWRQQKRSVHVLPGSSNRQQRTPQAGVSRGVQYPQLLDHQSLLQMRRQHSSTRLLSWWQRQQQLLHQQRRQRQLQEQWRAAAAAQAARSVWGTSSRRRWQRFSYGAGSGANMVVQYGSYSDWNSSAASSVDITTPVSFSSSGSRSGDSSSSSGDGRPSGGPSLEARALHHTDQQSGVRLAKKPVFSANQALAAGAVDADTARVNNNVAATNHSHTLTLSGTSSQGDVSRVAPADAAAHLGHDESAEAIDAVNSSSGTAASKRCLLKESLLSLLAQVLHLLLLGLMLLLHKLSCTA